jgi:polyisoprenoid-binding protein YceI
MKRIVVALSCVASLAAGLLHAADTYTIDPAHTNVGFAIKHMVVSTTKGRFNDVSGTIVVDEKNPSASSVKVLIKVASIDTGNAKRDEHLRAKDFFEVETFPEIRFESTRVAKTADGYQLTGTLTMKGVSKTVSFPFAVSGPMKDPWGNVRLGAEAALTINRQDYNITWNSVMDNGGLMIGNDVKIELSVEAIQEKR